MAYTACETCGKWHFDDLPHTCPPKWFVAPEGDRSNIYTVYARDAEDAVEQAADRYDNDCEGHLCRGNEEVFVACKDDGRFDFIRVAVEGEMVPRYSATELGPAARDDQNEPRSGI